MNRSCLITILKSIQSLRNLSAYKVFLQFCPQVFVHDTNTPTHTQSAMLHTLKRGSI